VRQYVDKAAHFYRCMARSVKRGIAITQGAKIRCFAPQGRLVAPILAKFGPLLPSSVPNFAKIGAWVGTYAPKN